MSEEEKKIQPSQAPNVEVPQLEELSEHCGRTFGSAPRDGTFAPVPLRVINVNPLPDPPPPKKDK